MVWVPLCLAGTARAQDEAARQEQSLQRARQILLSQEERGPRLRSAVETLFQEDKNPQGRAALASLVRETTNESARQTIFEYCAERAYVSPRLLDAAVFFLSQKEVRGLSSIHAFLQCDERVVIEWLHARIKDSELIPEHAKGAIAACGLLPSERLVEPLLDYWEDHQGSPDLPQIINTLRKITGSRKEGLPEWREWWKENAHRSRAELLEQSNAELYAEVDAFQAEIILDLRRATSFEYCLSKLRHPVMAIRVECALRLQVMLRERGLDKEAHSRIREAVLARLKPAKDSSPALAPVEVEKLAMVLAEVANGDEAARQVLLDTFWSADPRLRVALARSLQRASDRPSPMIAEALRSLLTSSDLMEPQALAEVIESLGGMGGDDDLLKLLEGSDSADAEMEKVRGAKAKAAFELAQRATSEDVVHRTVEYFARRVHVEPAMRIRLQLAKDLIDLANLQLANDRDRDLAFDALFARLTVDENELQLTQVCSQLGAIRNKEQRAAESLVRFIESQRPSDKVRAALIQSLGKLARTEALGVIVLNLAHNPDASTSAAQDAALQALHQILERAAADKASVEVLLQTSEICAKAERFEWAFDCIRQLVEQHASDARVAVELAELRWKQAVYATRGVRLATLREGFERLAEMEATGTELYGTSRQEIPAHLLRAALEITAREEDQRVASVGAAKGREILESGAGNREEVVFQTAHLHRHARQERSALELLEEECPVARESAATQRVLILKADLALEVQNYEVAMRCYELLVGIGGAGGRVPGDDPENLRCRLQLGQVYGALGQRAGLSQLIDGIDPEGVDENGKKRLKELAQMLKEAPSAGKDG